MKNETGFSKRTRKAILYFVVLLIVIAYIPRILSALFSNNSYQISYFEIEKDLTNLKTYSFNQNNYNRYDRRVKSKKYKLPPTRFNPNKYKQSDWMNLGLSEKQAQTILKFNKYGFKSIEDLKKCFVFSEDFLFIIKDSIYFEQAEKFDNKFEFKNSNEKKTLSIELNAATIEELMSLNGIGEFFAKQIIKKRDQLGGFVNKDQLLEVWKFDEEKLTKIESHIIIDKTKIKKININLAEANELKSHPYLNWNIANSIVKIRKQMGGFSAVSDIKRSVLVNDELYNKMIDYLEL